MRRRVATTCPRPTVPRRGCAGSGSTAFPQQQPAPTDCPTAVRNRPSNGRVVFGDDYVEKPDKGDKPEVPFLKKFGDDRKKKP